MNSDRFKQIFFTVVFLTILSGSVSLWLSSQDNLTSQQTRILTACNTTWESGIKSIFGLLAIKSTTQISKK